MISSSNPRVSIQSQANYKTRGTTSVSYTRLPDEYCGVFFFLFWSQQNWRTEQLLEFSGIFSLGRDNTRKNLRKPVCRTRPKAKRENIYRPAIFIYLGRRKSVLSRGGPHLKKKDSMKIVVMKKGKWPFAHTKVREGPHVKSPNRATFFLNTAATDKAS